jgi:hypothetical protein
MGAVIMAAVLVYGAYWVYQAAYQAGKREGSRKGYGVGYSRGRRVRSSSGCLIPLLLLLTSCLGAPVIAASR